MRIQDSNQIGLTSSMVRRKKKTEKPNCETSDDSATSECLYLSKFNENYWILQDHNDNLSYI